MNKAPIQKQNTSIKPEKHTSMADTMSSRFDAKAKENASNNFVELQRSIEFEANDGVTLNEGHTARRWKVESASRANSREVKGNKEDPYQVK